MPIPNPKELEGFLAELGLGSINEAQAYQQGLGEPMRTNNTETGTFAAIGQQLGRNIAPAVGGLTQAIVNSKGEGKFSFSQGVRDFRDTVTASGAGLEGGRDELRSRKRIRDSVATANLGDTSTVEGRIKLAEFVAEQAQKEGNGATRAMAMNKVAELRKEKVELDKLKAQTSEAQSDARGSATPDVWLRGETTPRTAQHAEWEDEDGKKQVGIEYYNETGDLIKVPVGGYSFKPPNFGQKAGDAPESIGQAFGRNTSPQDQRKLKTLVTTGQEGVRKMGRVLDTINDLNIEGVADQVMSSSGQLISFVENGVRNINGVLKTIGTAVGGKAKDQQADPNRKDANGDAVGWQGLDYWTGKGEGSVAADPSHAVWDIIQLPDSMKDNSAAAQNYRAQIMDLMYMAARLAEPSNRGLSDNDIIAAAKKLGGNTANPAVMMRRFSEMMFDSANNLDNELDVFYGAVEFENIAVPPGMTKREMFDRFIGGAALPKYRASLEALKKKYDFDIDPVTGRATFNTPIDADRNPRNAPGTVDDGLLAEIDVGIKLRKEEEDKNFLAEF